MVNRCIELASVCVNHQQHVRSAMDPYSRVLDVHGSADISQPLYHLTPLSVIGSPSERPGTICFNNKLSNSFARHDTSTSSTTTYT